jgi:hypothetical protein
MIYILIVFSFFFFACHKTKKKESCVSPNTESFCNAIFKNKHIQLVRKSKSGFIYRVDIHDLLNNDTISLNYSDIDGYYDLDSNAKPKVENEIKKYSIYKSDSNYDFNSALSIFCVDMKRLTKIMEKNNIKRLRNSKNRVVIENYCSNVFTYDCGQ